MSILRKGYGCEIYLYEHVDNFLVCQECLLGGNQHINETTIDGVKLKDYNEAKAHLEKHKAAGHEVFNAIDICKMLSGKTVNEVYGE